MPTSDPSDPSDATDASRPVELPFDGALDLHTFRPQDAGPVVADYLDECVKRRIARVRIVHGKGIGSLRRTVEAELRRHPAVSGFRTAPTALGGWGATLVDLRLDVAE